MLPEFRLLRIDLWRQKAREERIPERVLRRFLGGRGLGAYLALREIPPHADPLGPENRLYILTGPVTGTVDASQGIEAGRYHVVAKSPLTGVLGESNAGGRFGPWLRFSGYDGIVLENVSEEPVYISIIDGEVRFHDARHLWGRGVFYTEDRIREELGRTGPDEGAVLAIGPAGERMVKFASLINNKGRAAGRTGMGAVMGSKRVKAIYVYGTRDVGKEIVDKQKFMEAARKLHEKIAGHPVSKSLNAYGTAVLVNIINEHGALPTRNWNRGTFDKAAEISGETMAEKYLVDRRGCWGCTIRCGRITKVDDPVFYTSVGKGPEYETIFAVGSNLEIGDLRPIIKINRVLNDLGMDTISFGNTVGTLMEIYEKMERGEIPEDKAKKLRELLHDVKPLWGNAHAVIQLAYKTAYRDGIGDYLAEGAVSFAEEFGCPECPAHARRLELPAYDPRAINSMALAYATSNRGGCHLRAYAVSFDVLGIPVKKDPLAIDMEKVRLVKFQQDFFATIDSMIVCKFNTFSTEPADYVPLLSAAMGWDDFTEEELLTIGERIYNVERLFGVREGIYRDTLSPKVLEKPLPDGPARGRTAKEALEAYLPEYYRLRGWVDGKPTKETLHRLGLDEFTYIVS